MSFLTTSNPKLWFTLVGATAFLCCCCGGGLLWTAGRAGQEVAWLAAAWRAAEQATVPPAQELAVIREVQAGQPLDQARLDRLSAAAGTMAERTRQAAASLKSLQTPERFGPLSQQFTQGASSMEGYWSTLSQAISARDLAKVRSTLAEMQAFGDRFRQDFRTEMDRLYGSPLEPKAASGEGLPPAADPARP